MVLWTSGTAGSTVDRGRRGHEVRWCFTGVRRASTRGHRCSLALAEEDEEGEVEPEVCSPEHERRQKTVAKGFVSRGR
jgi:hypothetical protein